MQNGKQLGGMAAALAANVIFGFSFIFSKMALQAAHPLLILAVRFLFAFLCLNLLMLTGVVKINLRGKKKGRLILMGIAQPLCYFIFELYGLSMTSSALSGVIISLVPVAVVILCSLLGERPTALQAVCTVVSIAGVSAISILSSTDGQNSPLGIILLCLAVISAAVFNILSRSEAATFSPFERTYVMFLIGSIGFTVIAACALGNELPQQLAAAFTDSRFIVAELYLSVLSSIGAFMLYNYSTSVISAIQSSSFSNIITVVSVAAGVIILGDPFSPLQALLCAVIILGVWGVNAAPARK